MLKRVINGIKTITIAANTNTKRKRELPYTCKFKIIVFKPIQQKKRNAKSRQKNISVEKKNTFKFKDHYKKEVDKLDNMT